MTNASVIAAAGVQGSKRHYRLLSVGAAEDLPGTSVCVPRREIRTSLPTLECAEPSLSRLKVVQPGRSVRFPYVPFHVQTLDVTQVTEAGTLRAHVLVDFVPHLLSTYCYPYLPPKVTVRAGPRT